MTIGELASKSGVPASAIRYWERIGVLPKPVRVSGQRRYGDNSVDRLEVLRLAKACGFRLDEMRHLMHGFVPGTKPAVRWRGLAENKKREIESEIALLRLRRELVDRLLSCGCAELTDCGRAVKQILL